MNYFSKDYIQFFKELEKNNNRDWFTANKSRYESSVKEPFEKFVTDLIKEASKIDSDINIEAKDAVYRIYKDVRFSKDKTPYKLNSGAIISKFGRKSHDYPGFYVQLGADGLWIGGGAYMPSKEQLSDIRHEIKSNPEIMNKLLNDKKFKQAFSTLQGEQNKVMPAEFKALEKDYPFIRNKQFYYMAEYDAKEILRDDLVKLCIDHFKAGMPLNNFLIKAMFH